MLALQLPCAKTPDMTARALHRQHVETPSPVEEYAQPHRTSGFGHGPSGTRSRFASLVLQGRKARPPVISTNGAVMRVKIYAIAAVLAAGMSGSAMAQYACPQGYAYAGGACQPAAPGGYSNPASGAVNGTTAGAANGYATGGPVGAVVGGAVGTATGATTGAVNTATGVANGVTAPVTGGGCAVGYHLANNGYCYPN
jgi:hypothetical protein